MACRSCTLFGGSPEPKKRRHHTRTPAKKGQQKDGDDNDNDNSDDSNDDDDGVEKKKPQQTKSAAKKPSSNKGRASTSAAVPKKKGATVDRGAKAAQTSAAASGDSDSEQSSSNTRTSGGSDGQSRTRSRSGSNDSTRPRSRTRSSSGAGAGTTTATTVVHVTPSTTKRRLSVTPSTDGTVTTSIVTVTNATSDADKAKIESSASSNGNVDAASSTVIIQPPMPANAQPPPPRILTTYSSVGSNHGGAINNGMIMVSMSPPPPVNYTNIDGSVPTVGIYGQPVSVGPTVTTPLNKDGQPIRLSINVPGDAPTASGQVRLIPANGINVTRQPSQFGPPGLTRITSNSIGPQGQHMNGGPNGVNGAIAPVAAGQPMNWESGLCDCDEFNDPAQEDEGTVFPTFCPFSILLPCFVFGQNCSMLMNENFCCRSWWACREIVKLGPIGCCMCTTGGVAALMVPLPASPFFPCLTMVQRYQIMKKYNIQGGGWEVAKGFCVPCALTQHHNFLLIQRYYQRPREYPHVSVAPSNQVMI